VKAKLVMEIDGSRNVHITPHGVSMENLVFLAGTIQQYAGMAALSRGVDIESVRDHMLDVHLAAMEMVAQEAARRSRSVGQKSKRGKQDEK